MLNIQFKKFKIYLLVGFITFNYLGTHSTTSSFSKELVEEEKIKINANNGSKIKQELSNNLQKDHYLIGPGDVLTLSLFDAPELSGEYVVFNDGTISLPLIGTIFVSNFSISQVTNILEERYKEQLLRPELHLNVKVPRPILVSVIGEIERPGIYSLTKREQSILAGGPQITNSGLPTIVDAIQKAGGITQNANLTNVVLIRKVPGLNNKRKTTTINLLDLIFEGDHTQNLFLFDGDVIRLTKANKISPSTMKIARANLSPSTIKVRVIGQVRVPGLIDLSANTPLVQAVISAGGPIAWKANKGNVFLLRVNENGTVIKKRYKINLNENVSYEKNPPLKDKDIVLVESSALNKFSSGLGAVTEPISSLVTAITLFKLVN
tara:strand:- start:196 stop:1332 length:1137 start_codon:yes stop_codon:yes gene_type:complete